MEPDRSTVAELVARRWGDHRPALWCEDRVLTHHEVAAGAAARAALLTDLLPPGAEPHVGVLLDNTPESPLWLGRGGARGSGGRRHQPHPPGRGAGPRHPAHRVPDLVTERTHLPLLTGLELPGVRLLVTDTEEYDALLAP